MSDVKMAPIELARRAGTATVQRHADGSRTVLDADPVITVTLELLAEVGTDVYAKSVLTLDSAGEYRYRFVGHDPLNPGCAIFERLEATS